MPSNAERYRDRFNKVRQEVPFWKKTRYQVAAGLSAAAVVAGGIFTFTYEEGDIFQSKPAGVEKTVPGESLEINREFSGDLEETKTLIHQWNAEVGSDSRKLEQYMPRIAKLSAAYFSRQMTAMFPEKAQQYDKEKLFSTFVFLNEKAFMEKDRECNSNLNPLALAFNGQDGKIYVNPRRLWKGMEDKQNAVKASMVMGVHELMHNTAPLVVHNPPVSIAGSPLPITSQKGLLMFAGEKYGVPCSAISTYWTQQEEAVVEDAVTDLMQHIGVANTESGYMQYVQNYRERALGIPGVSRQKLLEKHQSSDMVGIFVLIGEAAIGKNVSQVEQINAGGNIMVSITK